MTEEQIDKLIQALSETGAKGFEIAMRGITIEGVGNLLLSLLFLGVCILATHIVIKFSKKIDTGNGNDIDPTIGAISSVTIPVSALFMFLNGHLAFMKFVAPEWMAIKALLELMN